MPLTTTIPDEEAMEAFKLSWDPCPNLGGQFGPLQAGRLKSSQIAGSEIVAGSPYAKVASEKLRDPQYYAPGMPGQGYKDYRKVTLTAVGTKAQCVMVATAIPFVYAWLPDANSPGPGSRPILTYPPGVILIATRPQGDPTLEEDPTVKAGQDIWRCVATFEVCTSRTIPTALPAIPKPPPPLPPSPGGY